MSAVPRRSDPVADSLPKLEPKIELESVDCLLCGGQRFNTVVFASDPLQGLGGNFRVVRCSDCGLHFTNPRPTPGCIGLFYPEDYDCWTGHGEDRRWRTRLRQTTERLVLRRFFGYPPQPVGRLDSLWAHVGAAWHSRSDRRQNWIPWRAPGRLLDFGCGGGDFLVFMRRYGWTVTGLDMSTACARGVTERTGVPVHVGSLPHPEVRPQSFDAITMWNALEHVHDPRATVRNAREALRPGGLLVVGVPNIGAWSFRYFQHEWYPLKLPIHLTHFTPWTLQEVVRREGFHVLSLEHVARPHFLRKSARRAAAAGWGPKRLRWLQNKRVATAVANWTERTQQADFIRLVAERV